MPHPVIDICISFHMNIDMKPVNSMFTQDNTDWENELMGFPPHYR